MTDRIAREDPVTLLRSGESLMLPDGPGSDPILGRLKLWATNDAINGQVLHFRGRGAYASLIDTLTALGFVAETVGSPGNDVTIEYVRPVDEQSLLVSVDGTAISVRLGVSGDAIAASLTTALGIAEADLTFTAQAPGVAGDDISIDYLAPTEDTPDTVSSADGDAISVALAGNGPVAAAFTFGGQLVFTALAAGIGGNALKVRITHSGDGHLYWGWNGGDPTNPNGAYPDELHATVPISGATPAVSFNPSITLDDFINHFNAATDDLDVHSDNAAAAGLVLSVALAGGASGSDLLSPLYVDGSHPLAIEDHTYSLSGGLEAIPSATADDVKAAVEADTDSNALVAVEHAPGNDGSGIVTAGAQGNLANGHEAHEVTSIASDVQAAIERDADADALVVVLLQNDQLMDAMDATPLEGGDDDALFDGQITPA